MGWLLLRESGEHELPVGLRLLDTHLDTLLIWRAADTA
jgi:hypothetical protein